MTEDDVDPENPRPRGHYPRFRDNEWHYVPDELAQTISLGPAGDGEPGQDWVLTYTPERRDEEDREKVLVRLTPRALHELYGGDQVDLDKAIPNGQGAPCHRHCWAEAYGAPTGSSNRSKGPFSRHSSWCSPSRYFRDECLSPGMSLLTTAKWYAIVIFRFMMLAAVLNGVYFLWKGALGVALIMFALPVLYFARQVWVGYRRSGHTVSAEQLAGAEEN